MQIENRLGTNPQGLWAATAAPVADECTHSNAGDDAVSVQRGRVKE